MMRKSVIGLGAASMLAVVLSVAPAMAQDGVTMADGWKFVPLLDARLRYEYVEQDGKAKDANAVTARLRSGFELKHKSGLSALAEAEATLAIAPDYNSTSNGKTAYPVVADPQDIGLNRLQIAYRSKPFSLTVGRQRINLDDQRFVGSVAWRQNEQTFDAVRAETSLGPVSVDATYAISQHTIFGYDAGPRRQYDGEFAFLSAAVKTGPLAVKAFAYLIDYDADEPLAIRGQGSQSYGVRATADFPLAKGVKLSLLGSYANQSEYGSNTARYHTDFGVAEATLAIKAWKLTGGYELLGSDPSAAKLLTGASDGAGRAFQTPLATLHKFNGWADLFLTTPNTGIQDYYGTIGWTSPKLGSVGPVNIAFTYHHFDSAKAGLNYGDEYDAIIGTKLMKRLSGLIKFARYERSGAPDFSNDVDTTRLWIELDYSL